MPTAVQTSGQARAVLGLIMKNVMYFYNGVQSEEELHDDELVAKLTEGQIMERAGENWKIVQVETVTVASEPERTDVVKVFLSGPEP
jgi:hypothetical protein